MIYPKRIACNTLWLYLRLAVVTASDLVTVRLLLRALGLETYGVFAAAAAALPFVPAFRPEAYAGLLLAVAAVVWTIYVRCARRACPDARFVPSLGNGAVASQASFLSWSAAVLGLSGLDGSCGRGGGKRTDARVSRICYNLPSEGSAEMRNPRGERNILVVHQMECQSGNLKLRGIFAAAKRRGYTVRFVPSNTIGLPIDDYIRLWSPLGLITGDSEYVPSRQNDKVLPTVYLDTDRRRRRQGVRVASDQEKLARSAFDALSAFGYGNYAYVPYCLDSAAGEAYWSLERHRAFARMVRRDVGKCVRLAPSYCQNGDRQVLLEAFRAWLDRVAKPCAVFAANDKAADYLVSMCSLCGVSVPDEIAVIGVDNNPLVCDNAPTPIASVEPDFRRCGELSVELLDEMIGGGKPAAENLVTSLRGAAATRGLGLADVNATMWASREAISPSATARTKVYTRDGVHMNSAGAGNYGNVAMAAAILKAMGATDADFAALVAADSATWGSLEKITVATKAASGTAPVTTGGSAASPVNLVTLVRESGHPPVTGGWSSNTVRSERRVYDGGSVDDTFSRCMCYLDGSGTYTFNYAIADDFNPDGDFVVTSYRIVPSTDTGVARQPKDFALYGSNNGWQTQSLIHSAEGVTDLSAAFAVPAPKSYRAYRLVVTRTQGDGIVSIADLEFNGYATATKTTPDVLSTLTVVVNSKGGDELGRRVIDNIGAGESWSWDLAELLGDKDVKSATAEGAGASISDKVLTVSNITATETVTVTIELDVYEGGTEPIDLTRLLRREETEISYAGTTVGNASYPAKYALDGDPDTQCLLTVGTEANPAIYAFQVSDAWRPGEKVRLTSFDLLCAGYTPEGRMPKDFTLQAKNESSGEWQIVGSWTDVTGWASGQSKTFEIEHPINSRAYRFVVTKGGNGYCTFADVTLYGTVNDDDTTHLHSWESFSETPANCVTQGSRAYTCPCGESDATVLPLTDHTPGEWEVEKAATDTEEGLEVVKCTVCETVLDSRVIPVQGETSDLPTADTIELVAPMREAGALSYSSPGSLDGYGPELAFDGNTGTHWLGNNANVPCYLTVTVSDDFNGGKGVRVRRVSLYNDMESRAVTNFNFQGSVDGTDWMTLASYDGALWNNLELEVASPDFYKSYRIEVNNPRRNYYHCIAEIKLYGELRDPLLIVPATVPNAVYDGDHAYCPDIEVRSFATGEVLQPGKGTYRLEWANNTTLGTATVRIIGREAYAGDIYERSFKIVPAGWTEGDVFVATDGNDTEGDGSPEKPYATVSKGVTAATAGHTVFLKTGTYRSSGQISIGKALAIRGTLPDREATVFSGDSDNDGEPDKPGFLVSANVKVAFADFTIEKCYNTGGSTSSLYGPALCLNAASCDVSLSNMCLRASGTSNQGKLVWVGGGTIDVVDCAIVDNVKAVGVTDALFYMRKFHAAPTLTMRNCIATNNTCYILADEGVASASVTDSLFEGNRGGVIALNGGCTVDRCRFIGNAAAKYGSAGGASIIYFDAGKNAVRNSLFRNSTGGSLFYFWTGTDLGATFDNGLGDYVQNCTFQDNSSGTTDNYSQTKKANWFIENCFFYRTTGSKPTMGGFLADNQRNNYIFDVGAKSPFVEGTETGECRYNRNITNAGYLRSGIESETDLVGAPRVQDGRVDLGCRERKPNGLVLMVR